MKKIISLIVAAILVVSVLAVVSSAADPYLDEKEIPYATAVTFDGKLDDWTKAAKFTVANNQIMPVGCPIADGASMTLYFMWDETYLYFATEVSDKNNGRLVYGIDGDNLVALLDIDETLVELQARYDADHSIIAGDITDFLNLSMFNVAGFPVVGAVNSTNPIGYHVRIGSSFAQRGCTEYDVHAPNPDVPDLKGDNSACSGDANGWIIEARFKWADLSTLFSQVYGQFGMAMPEIKAGTVLTVMPSYHDCTGDNNGCVGWYLGQNKLTTNPQATPNCYAFKGTLGAKPEAPATGDLTSLAVVVASIAAAAVIVGFKKH